MEKKSREIGEDPGVAAEGSEHRAYFSRELSWLEFNARVLAEGMSAQVPLLERLKFLAIFSSNLDEFFMVRVAGLKRIKQENIEHQDFPGSLSVDELLSQIRKRTLELVATQYRTLNLQVFKELANENIRIVKPSTLKEAAKEKLRQYFLTEVAPVLTPLAVDPGHPFPYLSNLGIYLIVSFDVGKTLAKPVFGLVEIPSILPRLVRVQAHSDAYEYVLLEDLIAENLETVFIGFDVKNCFPIRVTRNLDYNLLENEVVDLLKSIQKQVTKKSDQEVVRIEVAKGFPKDLLETLKDELHIRDSEVYEIDGPLNLSRLMSLYRIPRADLLDPPFNPRLPQAVAKSTNLFELISRKDLLVHHPFDSFYTVTEFLNAAAHDPQVLAIKQTLYRTSGDSPIIDSLIKAAENGKQVAAIIELKARFDEKNNIVWARRLQRAGVHVVFGFIGFKTHAKSTLVVRREQGQLKRYVHLSTGNYNSSTAKLYTDLGLFTVDKKITSDIGVLFNILTGYNVSVGEQVLKRSNNIPDFEAITAAPFELREHFIEKIEQEIQQRRDGRESRIIAKVNALVDRAMIDKLYEASAAGVEIKLIVRGICCLVPGVKGLSENIEVISVIDRYLEHSRIFYFENGGNPEVYLSSADWMPRNFDRRIEVAFPVCDPDLKLRICQEVLETYLQDNTKAWNMLPDCTYRRKECKPSQIPIRAQTRFIDLVREEGVKSISYEKAIRLKGTGSSPIAAHKQVTGKSGRKKRN